MSLTDDQSTLAHELGDRYHFERELGRGGMGAVYLARDRTLDRPVALKVLPPEFAAVPDLRERFLRETRLAAGFSHPNIVPVYAVEESATRLAFAMAFVEGESLTSRVLRDGPLSRRDTVRLLQDVGYALAYAHGRGVVHRDIKPDNIMIERATGRALVMDFGIARAITPLQDTAGLTRVGEVVGTPEYMSPEQASGDHIDGRSDLYSLGLVAFFATTGRTAMADESTQRVLVRQLTVPIPPLSGLRADLPPALTAVVDRCCAKDPADRFANAEALVDALEATQLAGADVPVSIRLLAPELTSIGTRAVSASLMLVFGFLMLMSNGNGNVFSIGIIVSAMLIVNVSNAVREIRRLRATGYTSSELQRLLAMTLSERDEERARRLADQTLVKRRRARVWIAAVVLVVQSTVLVTLRIRATTATGAQTYTTAETVFLLLALLSCTAAVAILAVSPFRRTATEQLFRVVWLGRVALLLMERLGPRSPTAFVARSIPQPIRTPGAGMVAGAPSTASVHTLTEEVRRLHARVDALEARAEPTR
jgi:eukaryotic-like serine/threonine-protein kinase